MYNSRPQTWPKTSYASEINPGYNLSSIKDADTQLFAEGDYGTQLLQEIKTSQCEVWQIEYDLKNPVIFDVTAESPVLKIGIVVAGSFTLELDGASPISFSSRHLYLIYMPHYCTVATFETAGTYRFFEIHPSREMIHRLSDAFHLLSDLQDHMNTANPFIRSKALGPDAGDQMAIMFRILNNNYQGKIKDYYVNTKAFEFLLLSLVHLSSGANKPISQRELSTFDEERIREAHHYILDNIENPLSVSWLARHFRMDEKRFRFGFKHMYGVTPFSFLLDTRLDKAMELLLKTNISVSELSVDTGYSNASSFIAAFTRRFGQPPSAFRRRR